MFFHQYFRALMKGERRGLDALVMLPLLAILSIPYAAVMRLRAQAFRYGVFRTYRLQKPVISVGNITAGGTGKSPMVAWIARYLLNRGKRVAVLSRGYGGSCRGRAGAVSDGRRILMTPIEAGDEPVMLAETVPGLMVVVGADRYQAGLYAQQELSPDIFILDDGFQHQRLYRDLNILLLDAEQPFDNGHVLPAGLMRESRKAAARADLFVYTRCRGLSPVHSFPDIPFCRANHEIVAVRSLKGEDERETLASLRSSKGVAFAGIANPEGFFSMLRQAGLNLVSEIPFSDHCGYGEEELASIAAAVELLKGDYLITTEKDAVKLSTHFQRFERVYAAILEVSVLEEKIICSELDKLIAR
jgi:tetraacyldisaccharide 4'-kinase